MLVAKVHNGYMETTDTESTHLGARVIDGVITLVVGAMSSFWLDGALATD